MIGRPLQIDNGIAGIQVQIGRERPCCQVENIYTHKEMVQDFELVGGDTHTDWELATTKRPDPIQEEPNPK